MDHFIRSSQPPDEMDIYSCTLQVRTPRPEVLNHVPLATWLVRGGAGLKPWQADYGTTFSVLRFKHLLFSH